jgi:flagellar basal body-associated protein FliL
MTDNSEFRPIHPNITDASMINDNDAVVINKTQKYKTRHNKSNILPADELPDTNIRPPPQTKMPQQSWQKTVIICVLVVFIVVLCIMLIYQLYKHFTADEQACSQNTEQSRPEQLQPERRLEQPRPEQSKTSVGEIHIPDNVNTLDNDYLERYVKKTTELSVIEEVDSLLEEHHKEMNDTDNTDEHTDIKIEEVSTPVRELNRCTFTIRKRGKKNTTCGKPCVEELCDDHKS